MSLETKQQKWCILKKIGKKTLSVRCAPLNFFQRFELFLGFYKLHFSGTTFLLVEMSKLFVYRLFKNLKILTFVWVKRQKTLNDAA